MGWGLREWTNVLRLRGTIDPATIEYVEQRLKELKEDYHICYDETAHNKDFMCSKDLNTRKTS